MCYTGCSESSASSLRYSTFLVLLISKPTTEVYGYSLGEGSNESYRANTVPKLEDVLVMSKDMMVHQQICENFLSDVVGAATWKKNYTCVELREFVSVSDMALLLLLLENSWERWTDKVDKKRKTVDKTIGTLYTSKKANSQDGERDTDHANSKWSAEGIRRYNELSIAVRDDWKSQEGKEFHANFLRQMTNKENNVESRRARKKQKIARDEVDVDETEFLVANS